MVHPLVITAAATAGVGAVVAFELAVFKPWREENWPHGFGEGVRTEFLKIRGEVEQAVNEIRDDLRTIRDGRRRGSNSGRGGHRRLSDDELDDFRRGVGEEASSESAQHEFEMHERQAGAYRDRIRASLTESMTADSPEENVARGLRRRRPPFAPESEVGQGRKIDVPVLDIRRPASTGSPHDRLGEATENVDDGALSSSVATAKTDLVRSIPTPLEETKEEVDQENHAAKNGLLGLEFSRHEASSCAVASPNRDITSTSDPFADIVDGTASSWHAVFSDRAASTHEEDHVLLDTNGLSQTLSDQHNAFPDTLSNFSGRAESPYQLNRALATPTQAAPSTGSRDTGAESEPDFEVLSDTADSEGRWSHLHAPPSPTISTGSEAGARGALDVLSMGSDGEDSWAELSEAGSDSEGAARTASSGGAIRRS